MTAAINSSDNNRMARHAVGSNSINITVVSSHDEMQMIVAVRSLVFLGKPGWTYTHTFDANDFCSTHLLATVAGEPAGTVRVRWFKDFARIERIAIREEFRSLVLLNRIATAALRLCRHKGYELVGGLTYPDLIGFWGRHGAKPCGEATESDYGVVVPILGTPREWADIKPVTLADAGSADFEWQVYSWEGAVVASGLSGQKGEQHV